MTTSGTLYKYIGGSWEYRGSKYITINSNYQVWAGSISSRSGWTTTPAIFGTFEDDGIYFTTVNGSDYKRRGS